ncbi:MAG: ABC transporter ATP-binding protein [Selenomonadaceae bacterium]|nr:ABC transporter ATP-binding protein [Selenomonadaceae bacterium]
MRRPVDAPQQGQIAVIIFDDVTLSFGRHELFKNISLKLRGGQVIGITGKNGAGKSTFLKLAGKIIRPDSGSVNFPVEKKIAAVSPEMKIYDGLTADENLFFFGKLRGKTLSAEKIFELGLRVGLDLKTFAKVRAENFSTGMRQRLKFAILLSVEADIWLLDEPTANLDDDGRENFFNEIQVAKSDKIILLATNDKAEEKICDEIIRLPLNN